MSDPGKGVFLSYASQDADAARRISEALRRAGIDAWFDQDELRGGDTWDQKIRRQIRDCALFVPIISAATQNRTEGYFRLEWHLAEQRSLLMAKGRAFLLPVCLDDTREPDALVPDAFVAVQWSRPASDAKLDQFVRHVQGLLAQPFSASRATGSAETTAATSDRPEIPDYELLRLVGRGSYGDVWLARTLTGTYRAIKIVWRNRFADAAPFEREFRGLKDFSARAVGEAAHLALLHVGRNEKAGFFYYVMELADDAVRGREIDPASYTPLTFAELRSRRARLPAGEVTRLGVELARSLASLHDRGLVHRDVKPSNIIITGGTPKLADIGLVAPVAEARTFVGTEGFVPPEGPGTPTADVYALGKVLYELWSGHDRSEFPLLPAGLDRLPDQREQLRLNDVILRACDPQAAKRHRDGTALLADLQRLDAGKPVATSRRWQLGGAALLLVSLTWAGWRWLRPDPRDHEKHAVPTVTSSSGLAGAPAARNADATTPSATASGESLAVLPLDRIGRSEEDIVLAEGLHAEIVSTLGRVAELRVISTNSAILARQAGGSLAAIAAKLGVDHLITGTLQKVGPRVRIVLELRRAKNEELIWNKTYERAVDDILALQADIADDVARTLQARERTKREDIAASLTKNPAAYEAYLQALHVLATGPRNAAQSERAITAFARAVALDPHFFSAVQALAVCHANAFRFSETATERARHAAEAKKWGEAAAKLLPGGAGESALLGYYTEVVQDFARAAACAQRALLSWPNNPSVHNGASYAFSGVNRMVDALVEVRRAIAVDPLVRVFRENELDYLVRLRRLDEWRTAEMQYVAVAGSDVNRPSAALRAYVMTGAMPVTLDGFGALDAIAWLRRERQFDAALVAVDKELAGSQRTGRTAVMLWTTKCDLLRRLGRATEAAQAAAAAIRASGNLGEQFDPSLKDYCDAIALAAAGRDEDAIAAGRRWVEARSPATQPVLRWDREVGLARIYAQLKRPRECADLLARLLRAPTWLSVPMLRLDPDWDNVRADPAFQELMATAAAENATAPTAAPLGPASVGEAGQKENAAPHVSVADEKSVAVLPLENLSVDPSDAYFADGMQAEIISTLQRVSDLKVPARQSTLAFRGSTAGLEEIAARLGVANIMTGSIRRGEQTVRIVLELRRARDDGLIWTKTYDRPRSDVLSIQTEIADEVARMLQARGTDGIHAAQFLTKQPEVYDRYLKLLVYDPPPGASRLESVERNILEAEKLVAQDPGFMPAVSMLAEHHIFAHILTRDPAGKLRHAKEAKRWAETAARLMPGPFGEQALVYYYTRIEIDNARSLALAEDVIRALPKSGGGYFYLSEALLYAGRPAEALAPARHAREINPASNGLLLELSALALLRRTEEWKALQPLYRRGPMTLDRFKLTGELPATLENLGDFDPVFWLWLRRRFADYVVELDRHLAAANATDADRLTDLLRKYRALVRLKRKDEAAALGREIQPLGQKMALEPAIDPSTALRWQARALVCGGAADEAITIYRRYVDAASPTNQVQERWSRERELAEAYAWLGRARECTALVRHLLQVPSGLTIHLLGAAEWDDVRSEPEFQALLTDPKNAGPL